MVGDLLCILEHANVFSAICMGYVCKACSTIFKTELTADISHDWGSSICYEAARSRPDIFTGVVGGVVPVGNSSYLRAFQNLTQLTVYPFLWALRSDQKSSTCFSCAYLPAIFRFTDG